MEMGYLNGSHEHSVRGRGGPMARGRGGPPPPRYIARLIYVHTNCIESLLVWISWSVSTISLVIKLFKKKKTFLKVTNCFQYIGSSAGDLSWILFVGSGVEAWHRCVAVFHVVVQPEVVR